MSFQNELFLAEWILELQEEIRFYKSQFQLPELYHCHRLFMVKGYDSSNSTPEDEELLFTEINLVDDFPDCLLDETWRDPQIWDVSKFKM